MRMSLKSVVVASLILGSVSAQAAEWKLYPLGADDFRFNFTLAGTMGSVDTKEDIASLDSSVTGLQLSFECPWFSSPQGNLRTHFNHNSYGLTNGKIKTFEINPHWFNTTEGDGISYGLGVGVGYLWNDINDDILYSANALADIEYRQGKLFAGVGVRYMWTQSKAMAGLHGFDNTLLQAKLGINFY